jgi:putative transposase
MSRFQISELDPGLLNLSVWPTVAEDAIKDPKRLEQYQRRRTAIQLLVSGASRREIVEKTKIDRVSVIRLFKRCLLVHPDGRLYGFRALIQGLRIAPYHRVAPVPLTSATSKSGASGAFNNLLRSFPDIDSLLQDYVLKRPRRKADRGVRSRHTTNWQKQHG